MKKINLGLLILGLVLFIFSCSSQKKAAQDDDFATESNSSENSGSGSSTDSDLNFEDTDNSKLANNSAGAADEFAEFEGSKADQSSPKATANADDELEKELNQIDGSVKPIAEASKAISPQSGSSLEKSTPAPETVVTNIQPETVQELTPPPQVAEISVPPSTTATSEVPALTKAQEIAQINSLLYQSNKNGGTVIINSSQPLEFTTRMNSATNQLIVEVQNSAIPKKLKRSLNTKDMASSIGSVDIYQKPNSRVSRFVIQLRPGSAEPLVQPEGNSLLIVGSANSAIVKNNNSESNEPSEAANSTTPTQKMDLNPDLTSEGIMNSQSLEDFLASNNKFYGKKISIEANSLDVNEAFKFLADESNVNMLIDDGVKGTITLKLRQVPWDQAFVLILKSKKLGYRRQGNVIRIASIETLLKEEDEALKLVEVRRGTEPLTVKRFFIGYADIADLEKKIKEFISSSTLTTTGQTVVSPSRGKVISDLRTSSLIVTETVINLAKIEKLIEALDSQPKQVLIEGKVVEAGEKFVRGLGVNWSSPLAGGSDSAPGSNLIRPSLAFQPGLGNPIFTPSFGLGAIGRPGDLGNLTASLSLGEREDKLRILSSPRISVLSNQTATISQTVNVSVDKVSTTSSTGGVTVATDQVAVGVSLKVTPQVSNEGTVVMDLDIERSFPGSANASAIEKRNAKTKVIVRSGQTAVIGGIFQADTNESTSGIPFLKDIPVFGLLFKGYQKNKSKNELVIFITPRIQKPVKGEATAVSGIE